MSKTKLHAYFFFPIKHDKYCMSINNILASSHDIHNNSFTYVFRTNTEPAYNIKLSITMKK